MDTSDTRYHSCVSSKRKYLFDSVVYGDLKTSCVFQRVIILSESWPSWVYSLGGIFGNVILYVSCQKFINIKKLWFEQSILWWKWKDWSNHWKLVSQEDGNALFCLQGSLEFVIKTVAEVLQVAPGRSIVMVVDTMDAMNDVMFNGRRLESRYVSHVSYGGTTKDKWRLMIIHKGIDWILYCKEDNTRQFGAGIVRCLGNIVDHKQSGSSSPPTSYTLPVLIVTLPSSLR